MSAAVIARRRVRLSAVVAVASGVVAAGVTGAGLLVPGGADTPSTRVIAAVVALAAGAVLVRLEGPASGTIALATVAGVAAAVCLVTLPASPVTFTLDDGGSGTGSAEDAPDGPGREVVIEPDAGPATPDDGGALALPEGNDIVVEEGQVLLSDPAGGRIVIGQATLDAAAPGVPDEGSSLVVVDGVVRRDDGGAVGPDLALGGTTFERPDGSRVVVGEGGLLEVPEPLEVEADDPAEAVDAVIALLLGLFAVLAFAPPLVRVAERWPVPLLDEPEPDRGPDTAAPASVEEGLAEVLRSMLADPDPRTSVIGAYARLLTAMAEAGHPRRHEEGPHEHLWRTLGPLGVRRQPLHRLAELFVRARFTPRPVTEADRQAAIAALADAVADLRLSAADVDEAAERVGVAS